MGGSIIGGKKAAATNKSRYGNDWYARIGALGGRLGKTGGFASNKIGDDGLTGRERASKAGAIGGRRSKRGKAKK